MCVCEDRHGRVNQGCMDCRVEVRDVCRSGQTKRGGLKVYRLYVAVRDVCMSGQTKNKNKIKSGLGMNRL